MQTSEENLNGNLTAMIDVVFQLIIFFVATTNLQSQAIEDRVKLAMAPHGAPVKEKRPTDVTISVNAKGEFSFPGGWPLTSAQLTAIMQKIRGDYGGVPQVIIRADGNVRHEHVKTVMDACTKAGIWQIKFAALREQG